MKMQRLWVRGFSFTMLLSYLACTQALASIISSRDFRRVQNYLSQLANQYSTSGALFELGQNAQGDSIFGLRIGNGAIKNLIVATHHGDEYGSTELPLVAAADLMARPIVGRTIFVVPVLNINGFRLGRRQETVGTSSTLTADPNRDYPGACATSGPFRLRSTAALASFIESENIVSLATLHASGSMILYPRGMSTPDRVTEYLPEFIAIGEMCTENSNYQVGNSADLLYPADGALEDFAFWRHGIWSMLFEVGTRHSPNERQLQQIVSENLPGLRRMMAEAPMARAPRHAFNGRCDVRVMSVGSTLDMRRE